jgi:alpha-tubulin suppressor-like RCC1 family protein
MCAGNNATGALGDGTTHATSTPVNVPLANVVQVSAGAGFACAIDVSKALYCWGWNPYGQLGNGSLGGPDNDGVASPQPVVGLTNVVTVAAGRTSACAIADGPDGKGAYCWGSNTNGETGIGTTGTNEPTPSRVMLMGTLPPVQVVVGSAHACALLEDGSVQCWGANINLQLSMPCTPSACYSSIPVVIHGIAGATQLTATTDGACVIRSGKVICWGDNATIGTKGAFTNAVAITGGGAQCTLLADSSVWCWGANDDGEVGSGSVGGQFVNPTSVQGL